MKIPDLNQLEHHHFFNRYIEIIPPGMSLTRALNAGKSAVINFFSEIPEEKLAYKYEADKWTIKEVLQHIIDTERIFAYRVFRIARGDKTSLADFEQDIYIDSSLANKKTRKELLEEFIAVRKATLSLINSLSDEGLKNMGFSSNYPLSARAAAFIIAGHELWHIKIIKERY
ncbi:MAG: DinB family protein [Bacteroidota bacterium]